MELEQRPESERSEDDFSELRHSVIEAAAIVPDRDEANSSLFESARVAILGSMQIFGTIRPGTGDGFRLSAATLPVGYLPAKELPQEPTEVSEEFFSQSGSRSTLAEMLLKLQIRDAPFGDLSAAPALTPLTRQLFDQLRQDMLVAARKILSESQYREFSRALQARPAEQGNESDSESTPSGAGATPEN